MMGPAFGANPEFAIETGAVRIVDQTGDRFAVLYEERTRGAKQSTKCCHTRWVTAVLVATAPGAFRWTHIHEVQVETSP
ncbi:MAG: hypothetical protein AAF928_13140 [Myxococcota bacterium]